MEASRPEFDRSNHQPSYQLFSQHCSLSHTRLQTSKSLFKLDIKMKSTFFSSAAIAAMAVSLSPVVLASNLRGVSPLESNLLLFPL